MKKKATKAIKSTPKTSAKSKKTVKKKTVKKVEKKQPVKAVEEKKNVLHPDHLRQMETMYPETEAARLKMSLKERIVENIKLSIENLKMKLEKEEAYRRQANDEYLLKEAQRKEMLKEFSKIYKIDPNKTISYNPMTGEIVE